MNLDQLASSEASRSGSTLFSIEFISGSILFSKKFTFGISTVMAKLFVRYLLFGKSKIFFGQVPYGLLLAPRQV